MGGLDVSYEGGVGLGVYVNVNGCYSLEWWGFSHYGCLGRV